MIKKFESFGNKEEVDLSILVDELVETEPEEVGEWIEKDGVKIVLYTYLDDAVSYDGKFVPQNRKNKMRGEFLPETKNWKLVDANRENGYGRGEVTITAIFLRISDNKEFSMWIHGAGFGGPSSLTMSDKLIEV